MKKKTECRMCGKYKNQFFCPSGDHKHKPGQIHSGHGAIYDCQWDCPNCKGQGFILLSLMDRILLTLFRRMQRVYRQAYPG